MGWFVDAVSSGFVALGFAVITLVGVILLVVRDAFDFGWGSRATASVEVEECPRCHRQVSLISCWSGAPLPSVPDGGRLASRSLLPTACVAGECSTTATAPSGGWNRVSAEDARSDGGVGGGAL